MNKKINKLITIIMLVINGLFNALFGLVIGKLIDTISLGSYTEFIKIILITFSILFISYVSGILGWSSAYKSSALSLIKVKDLAFNNEFYKDRNKKIDISKFTDKPTYLLDNLYMSKWQILSNSVLFIFSVITLLYINWLMCIVAFIVSILPLIIPKLSKSKIMSNSQIYSESTSAYASNVENILSGRTELKKYAQDVINRYIDFHHEINKDVEINRKKSEIGKYVVQATTSMVGNTSFVLVFLVGAFLVIANKITIGNIVSVIQLLNYLVRPITVISNCKSKIQSSLPILNTITETTYICIKDNNNFNPKKYINDNHISVNNLDFAYGDKYIFEGFSYDFHIGKKYLITGESGSGKSTLAKLLYGELVPISGSITIDDKYSRVRYVDQEPYIFRDSIYNNISLYRDIANDKINLLLCKLGLSNIDIKQEIDNSTGLSGGQKYRIALIRSIIDEPDILIVDEPTSALDLETTKLVFDFLCSLPSTVIIITHETDVNIINKFDSIIKL